MLTYPEINPVALQIGPVFGWQGFAIHWYGIMYLVGFLLAFWLCHYRRAKVVPPWTTEQIIDLLFYVALGVIFGGSLGYFLFYEPARLLSSPWHVFKFWEPGRSFHGGLIGVLVAIFVYCRVHKRRFWDVGDFIAPAIPIGLATGRLGNFINSELWGRVTEVPWGMVFPNGGIFPRHPSQLYEFFLEGVVLFLILIWYVRKPRPSGSVSALFLIFYGLFRYSVEFVREPDQTQGFVLGDFLTMGQALSLPMILFGLALLWYAKHNKAVRE